jgi:sulfonate transport system substrate-binding protein
MSLRIAQITRSQQIRRTVAGFAAVGAITAMAAGCGSNSSGTSTSNVADVTSPQSAQPIAAGSKVPSGTTLRVADQTQFLEGLLKDSGQDKGLPYKVQYSNFLGGPPMLQAFKAGSLDVGYVFDTPLIFAQAAHQNVVGVAAWATAHGLASVVNAPGQHLSGWASLKGQKVAYQQGTVEEAVLLQGLHSVGLTMKDITPVNLTTTSIIPALTRGSVNAGVLLQPLTGSYFQSNPTATTVVSDPSLTDRTNFLIAATSAITDPAKQAALADYITRVTKAIRWVSTHPTQWAQDLYVDQYKIPLATAKKLVVSEGKWSMLQLPGKLAGPQQALANLYTQSGDIPTTLQTGAEFSPMFNKVVAAADTGSGS